MNKNDKDVLSLDNPLSEWFDLSYAQFLTVPRLQFGGAFQITIENIMNPNQIKRGRGSLAFKMPEDSQEAIDPGDLMDSIRSL